MTEHDALAESAVPKGQKLAQEICSAVNAHQRMLKAWQEWQPLLFSRMNPNEVPSLFRYGWEARQGEVNDLSARIGGLEAELLHWKRLANER